VRFAFTPDQDMFRDAVRDLFADLCSSDALRAAAASEDARVPGLWPALGEMGVLAALVPEASGGLGLSEVDMVRVLEEAGYAGMPEPLTEHAAVAVPAVAEALAEGGLQVHSALLADAMAGRSLVTVALGGGPVPSGAKADAVVAASAGEGGTEEHLVLVTSWEATSRASIDDSRRLAEIAVTESSPLPGADAVLARDRAALGAAAGCIGTARRLLDITVGYVAERHQFGRPVGSYQAVKHHLADVRIAIEFAAPLVYRAAWTVAQSGQRARSGAGSSTGSQAAGAEARGRHVSMAKAMASDAVDRACRSSLQCHGAIGYTAEHDLQLWLKRGWVLSATCGDARSHRDRVADSLGI